MKRFAVLGGLLGTVALLTPSAAFGAAAGAGVISGNGSITPGLTATLTPQSATFTGTTVVTVAVDTGAPGGPTADTASLSCSFTYNSGLITGGDNVAVGGGSASGNCAGTTGSHGSVSVTCSVTVVRVGAKVIVFGQCTITVFGHTYTVFVYACLLFVPTSPPTAPVTSYDLAGYFALAAP